MPHTIRYQVINLLIEVNGMTKAQAIYKTHAEDEKTLRQWKKELTERKKAEAEAKKNSTLDLGRATFRKISTVKDMQEWLTYIMTQTNIPAETPIKMYSDEEGNRINGILSLDYQADEAGNNELVIIPLEEY